MGMKSSITDAGVGGLMALAGLKGAIYNVRINLGEIDDSEWVGDLRTRLSSMLEQGERLAGEVEKSVVAALG